MRTEDSDSELTEMWHSRLDAVTRLYVVLIETLETPLWPTPPFLRTASGLAAQVINDLLPTYIYSASASIRPQFSGGQ